MALRVQSAHGSLPLTDPEHYQKTATFSPDGTLLAVASSHGDVQLHRYPSMEPVFTQPIALKEDIYDTDFSHDGEQLAIATPTRVVVLSTAPTTTDGDTPTATPHTIQTITQPTLSGVRGTFRRARYGRGPPLRRGSKHALFTLVNTPPRKHGKAGTSYIAAWDADRWQLRRARAVAPRPATVLAVRYAAPPHPAPTAASSPSARPTARSRCGRRPRSTACCICRTSTTFRRRALRSRRRRASS